MGLLISLSFKTNGCTELIASCKEVKIIFVLTLSEFLGCLFPAGKHGRCVGVAAIPVPGCAGGLPTLSRKP